jgi:hypothetical protein
MVNEADDMLRLRADLRVVTDKLEDLFKNGEPPKGRSADERDAYLGWCDSVRAAISSARRTLEEVTI